MPRRHAWRKDLCLKCGLRRRFGNYPDPRREGFRLFKHNYFRPEGFIGTRPDECVRASALVTRVIG